MDISSFDGLVAVQSDVGASGSGYCCDDTQTVLSFFFLNNWDLTRHSDGADRAVDLKERLIGVHVRELMERDNMVGEGE